METNAYPILLDAKALQALVPCSRSMAYQFLNREDLPVVIIGERKFMHRDLFLKSLEEQATGKRMA